MSYATNISYLCLNLCAYKMIIIIPWTQTIVSSLIKFVTRYLWRTYVKTVFLIYKQSKFDSGIYSLICLLVGAFVLAVKICFKAIYTHLNFLSGIWNSIGIHLKQCTWKTYTVFQLYWKMFSLVVQYFLFKWFLFYSVPIVWLLKYPKSVKKVN